MKNILILLYSFFVIGNVMAGEKLFQGYVDNDWNNLSNWSGGGVPVSGDDVRIFAPCVLDNDNSIILNSLQVGIGGDFHLTSGDTIRINNTTDKVYLTYVLDLSGNTTIDGIVEILSSIDGGANLSNVTLNGSVIVDNINSGPEALLIQETTINGTLIVGANLNFVADYSVRVIGINNIINIGADFSINDVSRKGIVVQNNANITLNETITFPDNISRTCIESSGTIINNDSLFIKTNPGNFLSGLINRGSFTNNSYLYFPVNGQYSWQESGSFTNSACAFIQLEGRLYCTNNLAPPYYAYINNHGIIFSPDNENGFHYYGGSHTFSNTQGIVADPGGRFLASFDTNTGVKTKKLGFSSCSPGELIDFYEGSLTNISVDPIFLDTLLTQQAGTYDVANNKMILTNATVGKNKFFTKITDDNDACSIITPIIVDDFLEIKAFYPDLDMDNFGDHIDTLASCGLTVPGRVLQGGDCDDQNFHINPNAEEVCDGIDSNCDGMGAGPGEEENISVTFDETTNSDWYTPANWSTGQIPDFCSEVVVPTNKTLDLTASPATIAGLVVESNGRINLNNNLIINEYDGVGVYNEGMIFSPNSALKVMGAQSGTGIENYDSIYVNLLEIINLSDGIYNYNTGSIYTHNFIMDNISFFGLQNEGNFQVTPPNPPAQGRMEISNMEESIIDNYGTFILAVDYYGGGEAKDGYSPQYLILNAGNLHLNGFFYLFPGSNSEVSISNDDNLFISGKCTIGESLLQLNEFSTLRIQQGGQLIIIK